MPTPIPIKIGRFNREIGSDSQPHFLLSFSLLTPRCADDSTFHWPRLPGDADQSRGWPGNLSGAVSRSPTRSVDPSFAPVSSPTEKRLGERHKRDRNKRQAQADRRTTSAGADVFFAAKRGREDLQSSHPRELHDALPVPGYRQHSLSEGARHLKGEGEAVEEGRGVLPQRWMESQMTPASSAYQCTL